MKKERYIPKRGHVPIEVDSRRTLFEPLQDIRSIEESIYSHLTKEQFFAHLKEINTVHWGGK